MTLVDRGAVEGNAGRRRPPLNVNSHCHFEYDTTFISGSILEILLIDNNK